MVGPQVLAAKTFRWTLEQPVHPFYFNFLHQPHHFHQQGTKESRLERRGALYNGQLIQQMHSTYANLFTAFKLAQPKAIVC